MIHPSLSMFLKEIYVVGWDHINNGSRGGGEGLRAPQLWSGVFTLSKQPDGSKLNNKTGETTHHGRVTTWAAAIFFITAAHLVNRHY